MTAYATRADLYRYGLPRGTLGGGSRIAASALAATDTIELDEHGFETNDQITVRAAEGGSLPSPLAEGTVYFAIRLTSSTFQIAAVADGPPIDLTSDGSSVLVMTPLPFDDVLEYYSRFVDELLPADAVPLPSPFPVVIVAIVAELAAKKLQQLAGHQSVSVVDAEQAAQKRLERLATGIPIRSVVEAPTNLAVVGNVSASRRCRPEDRLP